MGCKQGQIQKDRKQIWPELIKAGILFLSALAVVKTLIIGLEVDEEYAVTLGYRIAMGDRMFLEMWEPHQTSAFLDAFFIKLYMLITGGTEYLVLYLRVIGTMLQLGISVFLYRTVKKMTDKNLAFFLAVLFFHTLPKWIQTPEFANMQIWFCMLTLLCLLQYYCINNRRHPMWLVCAAVCHAAMILAYPSCVAVFPLYLLAIFMAGGRRRETGKEMGYFGITCVILGVLYIGYFLISMPITDFIGGLKQMLNDGAHNGSVVQKFAAYGREMGMILIHLLAAAAAGGLVSLLCRKKVSGGLAPKGSMQMTLMLTFSYVGQMFIWLFHSREVTYPLAYYYGAVLIGILIYQKRSRIEEQTEEGVAAIRIQQHKCLFWFGIVASVGAWLACLSITNTTCYIMGAHLMPAVICAFVLLQELLQREYGKKAAGLLMGVVLLAALGTTLFGKGFLVRSTEGAKDTVFLTRQKALSGPSRNIYYRYTEGYRYNIEADLWKQYVMEGDSVLYVGSRSIMNMHSQNLISAPSTISTPTYDESLLAYWKRFPERYPDVIIIDDAFHYGEALEKLIDLPEPIAEVEDIYVYRLGE